MANKDLVERMYAIFLFEEGHSPHKVRSLILEKFGKNITRARIYYWKKRGRKIGHSDKICFEKKQIIHMTKQIGKLKKEKQKINSDIGDLKRKIKMMRKQYAEKRYGGKNER